jgi:BCD family chlorophyll transporter-like MFS transporter
MFWIWLGRAMMVLSTISVGLTTAALARGGGAAGMAGQDAGHWAALAVSLLLFSLGSAISGSTFLALLYDRAPEHQRGRAIGIVWTFLLIGFAVGGFAFGRMLPEHQEGQGVSFTSETLQTVFVVGGLSMAALWFLSMLGEERRGEQPQPSAVGQPEYTTSVIADLKQAMGERPMRFFFWYLALSMLFAFSQDLILEPFGGQVFGMDASHTTRFTAYWASTAILGTIIFLILSRRFKSLTNSVMSYIGVGFLIAAFAVFGLAAFAFLRPLVTIGLVLLGVGLGIWNVGTTGLMMDMSPGGRAGTFLGFWTLVVTLARGIGVSGGGIVRDVALSISGNLQIAYGVVFAAGVIGLVIALYALWQANIKAYKAQQTQAQAEAIFAGAMD